MGKITEQERTQLAHIIEDSGLYRLKSSDEFDTYLDHCMDGFANNPLFTFLSGGDFNPDIVKSTMGLSVHTAFDYSISYADSPELNACAVWIPSGIYFSNLTKYAQGIGKSLPGIGGVPTAKKIMNYVLNVSNMKNRITNHNDWYLYNYECTPEFDNDETFTKMLEPAVNYAWSTGRACYVESSIESRMSSYMKMGFHIVDEITIPNSNVKIYGMMV